MKNLSENTNDIINIHLISDSTAETIEYINQSIIFQFPDIHFKKFIWPLINKKIRIQSVLKEIKKNKGIVLYTIFDNELSIFLEEEVRKIDNCFINNPLVSLLWQFAKFLNSDPSRTVGFRHELNDQYFKKMDAINFTHEHDDGRLLKDIKEADIILIGISRTSKTPTSTYLAHRGGFKVLNIPFISLQTAPDINIFKDLIVVGLTINPMRLREIRQSRVGQMKIKEDMNYTNIEFIKKEIHESNAYFTKIRCPVIDTTYRSVEEVASYIIRIMNSKLNDRKKII